jgi:nucleoside phosphorylase
MTTAKAANHEIVNQETADTLKPAIHLLIVTATEVESEAVWKRMKPLPGRRYILQAFLGNQTYRIGQFGLFGSAHVQCRMGTTGRDASLVTTLEALDAWTPQAVIMPGIAFGRNQKTQSLCDLLLGEEVRNYEPERRGKVSIARGSQPRASPVLLNRALNFTTWNFRTSFGTLAKRHDGLLLSGEKLIDNKQFKANLMRKFPEAIGGEMEASGIAAACEARKVEWLVAKAICDWGDGTKSNELQDEAAAASTDFFHQMMSTENAFRELNMLTADEAINLAAPAELRFRNEGEVKSSFKDIVAFVRGLHEIQSAPILSDRVSHFISEMVLNAFQHGRAADCSLRRIADGFLIEDDGQSFFIGYGNLHRNEARGGGGVYSYNVLRSQHADTLRIMHDRKGKTNTMRIIFFGKGSDVLVARCGVSDVDVSGRSFKLNPECVEHFG